MSFKVFLSLSDNVEQECEVSESGRKSIAQGKRPLKAQASAVSVPKKRTTATLMILPTKDILRTRMMEHH